MYFAYGWPRVFQGIDDPGQKNLIYSHLGGDYLVLVSNTAIQLWTGGPDRVALGSLLRSPEVVAKEGEFFKACWSNSRHVLAVLVRLPPLPELN
jgi:hypothetical protein